MMVDGVDSLMAYSDIDERGTALALIVPKEDVMVEALADVTFEAQRDIMDEGNRAIKLSLAYHILVYTYTLDMMTINCHTRNNNDEGDLNTMEEVNALKIRNNLGEILDRLDATGEPILVSKGRKLRAVLVTPQDFEDRFLDYKVKSEKKRLLDRMHTLKRKKVEPVESIDLLRQLRGYNG